MNLKQQFDELLIVREQIETPEFQKFIMLPLKEEIDNLKNAYDCKTLTELATLKGKKQGLEWLIETLKQIDCDYKNIKNELKIGIEQS
jgi:hypothetical protein